MGLPAKLKNFATFIDGISYVGEVEEITLPKLKRKTEDWRGGGMPGAVKADMGIDALEMELTAGGFLRDVFTQWGAIKHDAVLIRFAGALQADDQEAPQAMEVTVRGRHEEIDPGNAKAGDKTAFKVKSMLSYYKLVLDGETLIEIDLVNMIEVIGGKDRMAQVRAILGV